jgi:hypothetical protein
MKQQKQRVSMTSLVTADQDQSLECKSA